MHKPINRYFLAVFIYRHLRNRSITCSQKNTYSAPSNNSYLILDDDLIKKRIVLNAYQAINKLQKIRGESIQSKDQENILFDYEKYLKSERPPSTENNTNIK